MKQLPRVWLLSGACFLDIFAVWETESWGQHVAGDEYQNQHKLGQVVTEINKGKQRNYIYIMKLYLDMIIYIYVCYISANCTQRKMYMVCLQICVNMHSVEVRSLKANTVGVCLFTLSTITTRSGAHRWPHVFLHFGYFVPRFTMFCRIFSTQSNSDAIFSVHFLPHISSLLKKQLWQEV